MIPLIVPAPVLLVSFGGSKLFRYHVETEHNTKYLRGNLPLCLVHKTKLSLCGTAFLPWDIHIHRYI